MVADLARIRREDVLRAAQELASEGVTATAGVAHRLVRSGEELDVSTVVDRALHVATGTAVADLPVGPHTPDDRDCALLLRGLGFEVSGEGLPPLRYTNAATVGAEHARATWALAARERLLEVAATYGESIDHHDLADFVQRRSLIRTTAQPRSWMGDVLARVAAECSRRREPLLTSLVVDGHGKVGATYASALATLRHEHPDDVDAQAAEERLACHLRFAAEVPDGAGPVVLTSRTARRRSPVAEAASGPDGGATPPAAAPSRSGRARAAERAPKRSKVAGARRTAEEHVAASSPATTSTCPVHFTVLPPSGICDYCD